MCKFLRCMVGILGPRNRGATRVVVGIFVVGESERCSRCDVYVQLLGSIVFICLQHCHIHGV